MTNFKLLIIEDDEEQIVAFEDVISIFNRENEDFKIISDIKNKLDEGLDSIEKNYYDGAIIDLRLNKSIKFSEEAEGNKIIRKIRDTLRIPVIINSGFLGDLDPEFNSENGFFRLITRGEIDFYDYLTYFKDISSTGILNLIGENGSINKCLTEVFWERISKDVNYWVQQSKEGIDINKIISRYIISYLHEKLDLNDIGEFEIYHPAEIYLIPPVKEKLFTGDILLKEGKRYVILMPPCDMANDGKVDTVVIGKVEDIDFSHIKTAKKMLNSNDASEEDKEKAKNKIQKLLNNSFSLNYHFLPPCNSFSGGFINFRKIESIKVSNLKEGYKRLGSISGPFIKDVLSRFSQYYARQGQPTLNTKRILEEILAG